jgi:ubiquinone/menaquinone biosynthesis C-methylase UbiE
MGQPRGCEFDRIARDYDRERETYPPRLVELACSLGRLAPGSRVLEIGCGTGQLTEALSRRRLRIDAVDPGVALIDIARHKLGDQVAFHLGRFEDVELPDALFDAVFSATAFTGSTRRSDGAKRLGCLVLVACSR